jgi:hypothetical protein
MPARTDRAIRLETMVFMACLLKLSLASAKPCTSKDPRARPVNPRSSSRPSSKKRQVTKSWGKRTDFASTVARHRVSTAACRSKRSSWERRTATTREVTSSCLPANASFGECSQRLRSPIASLARCCRWGARHNQPWSGPHRAPGETCTFITIGRGRFQLQKGPSTSRSIRVL